MTWTSYNEFGYQKLPQVYEKTRQSFAQQDISVIDIDVNFQKKEKFAYNINQQLFASIWSTSTFDLKISWKLSSSSQPDIVTDVWQQPIGLK